MPHGKSYLKIHKFKRCLEIFAQCRVNTFVHGTLPKYKLTIYSLTFARKCKRYLSFEIVPLYVVIERQIGRTQAMARENKCSTIKISFAALLFRQGPARYQATARHQKYKLTIYSLTFARKCKRYLSFEIVPLCVVIERQIGRTQAMARENKCSTIKICFAGF